MSIFSSIFGLLKQYAYFSWVIGLTCLLGYTAYRRYETLNDTALEIRTLQGNLDVMQRNIRSAKGLSADLKTAEALSTTIQEHMVDPTKKAANIGYFYALENTTSTQVQQATQLAPSLFRQENNLKYWQVPYKLTIAGSFQNALLYLEAVQAGPHFMQLQDITFDQSQGERGHEGLDAVQVSFNLSLLGKE